MVADSRVGTWIAGICLCLALSSQPAIGKERAGNSRWVANGIVVDGNNNEWPMPFPFTARDARVQYSIANDGNTLYVCVKASDEVEKKKLIVNGLTLMLDTAGDKQQKIAINLSVVRKEAQDGEDADDAVRSQQGAKGAPPVPLAIKMHTGGMGADDWQVPAPGGNVRAAVGVNDFAELVWEIAIPFSILGWASLPADAGRELSVGMLISGVDDGDLTPARLPGHEPPPVPQQENAMKMDGQNNGGAAPQKPGGDGAPGGRGEHARDMEQEEPPISTASYADERERLAHTDKIWKNIRLSGNSQ